MRRLPRSPAHGAAELLIAAAVAAALLVSRALLRANLLPRPNDHQFVMALALATTVLVGFILVAAIGHIGEGRAARLAWYGFATWIGSVAIAALFERGNAEFFRAGVTPYAIAWLVAVLILRLRPSAKVIYAILSISAVVVAVLVVADAEGLFRSALARVRRPAGILDNRNHAAEYLVLCLPVCLLSFRRQWMVGLGLPIGIALAWTRCRTGWITAGSSTIMLLWLLPHEDRARATRVAFVAACGFVLALISPNKLSWSDSHPYWQSARHLFDFESGSGQLRFQQYVITRHLMAGHWLLGLGPGGWYQAMVGHHSEFAMNSYPHSDYLRSVADGGVLGLGGLLLWLAATLQRAWACRRASPGRLVTFSMLLVMSAVDTPLRRPESLVLAVLLAFRAWPLERGVETAGVLVQRRVDTSPPAKLPICGGDAGTSCEPSRPRGSAHAHRNHRGNRSGVTVWMYRRR